MDHDYIRRQALIERYHQGDLPLEEEARFEEHFLTCERCREELEAARSFRLGMRTMAARDTRLTAAQWGLLAWLSRGGRGVRTVVLAAVAAAIVLPWAWLVLSSRQWDASLRQAREEAAGWRQRHDTERLRGEQLDAQIRELTESAPRPASLPVVLLSTLRSGPGAPVPTVDLNEVAGPLAVAVDAGADPRFQSYRLAIHDGRGTLLWQGEDLQPNSLEAIMITVPSDFFAPGDYQLELEGIRPSGISQQLGTFTLRAVRGR